MTAKLMSASSLKARIETVSKIQAQMEIQIKEGHEGETDRLSALYESEIRAIFTSRVEALEALLLKLDFSVELLAAEHAMPSLVTMVFDSLRDDIVLSYSGNSAKV